MNRKRRSIELHTSRIRFEISRGLPIGDSSIQRPNDAIQIRKLHHTHDNRLDLFTSVRCEYARSRNMMGELEERSRGAR
jgi:hypothetical protein